MLVLSGQLMPVDRLGFSPASALLAAAGGNKKPIELWSLAQPRQPQHRLPVRLERTNWSFCFNPASGLLHVAEDTHVICFDPKTGEEVWRVEPEENSVIAGIDVSPDGRRLATAAIFQYVADDG